MAQELPRTGHIAMTMHGIGYGLDERESFLAQISGILDATLDDPSLSRIRVTIIERNRGRAERLQAILDSNFPKETPAGIQEPAMRASAPSISATVGDKSNSKPHVFVAMPFGEEMDDVYIFGIQGPVNAAGYLCERVDMAIYSGAIMERIKSRIETAAIVVADLTGSNPNVYLEVGYAWGRGRPTLLLTKRVDDLKFDVRDQRCIIYRSIADLAEKLKVDLAALK